MKEIKFEVELQLVRGHTPLNRPFRDMPLQHLVKAYHEEAERVRVNIEQETRETNIKYLGKCALIVHNTIANGAVKEIIRKVDAIENETKYIKDKIGRNYEYVDVEARNAFPVNLVTPSLIKCASGYNHYGQRDAAINKQLCNA